MCETLLWAAPQIQVLLAIVSSEQLARADQTLPVAVGLEPGSSLASSGRLQRRGPQAQRGAACRWVSGHRSVGDGHVGCYPVSCQSRSSGSPGPAGEGQLLWAPGPGLAQTPRQMML